MFRQGQSRWHGSVRRQLRCSGYIPVFSRGIGVRVPGPPVVGVHPWQMISPDTGRFYARRILRLIIGGHISMHAPTDGAHRRVNRQTKSATAAQRCRRRSRDAAVCLGKNFGRQGRSGDQRTEAADGRWNISARCRHTPGHRWCNRMGRPSRPIAEKAQPRPKTLRVSETQTRSVFLPVATNVDQKADHDPEDDQ